MNNREVFETGQAAKICKVSRKTVIKWFDSGRLKGFRIPGSKERRIPKKYLVKFCKEHGIPLGDLEDETRAKILVVSQDWVFIANLKRELPDQVFKVIVVANSFDAGIEAKDMKPDCIIVDFSIGQTEALQICQNLRRNAEFADIIIIALLPEECPHGNFDRSYINETFRKPFDSALLAERLRTLVDAKRERY